MESSSRLEEVWLKLLLEEGRVGGWPQLAAALSIF
jgi:hypothetical protein